jgi:hypothetical protein
MQKKRANVSLLFAIIAVAVEILGLAVLYFAAFRAPFRPFLSSLLLMIPSIIVAFIVPVFVIIGRKSPKAKKALAIIAFIFLGLQVIFVILLFIFNVIVRGGFSVQIGRWNLLSIVNGSGLLSDAFAFLRQGGWSFLLAYSLFFTSDVFYILKNLLGAIDLSRRPRAAAPAQPYYAPQYAPQQYAQPQYAQPQYAQPQAPQQYAQPQAPQQYAAPAAPVAPAPAPAAAPKFCPNCGSKIEGSGAFCSGCGAPLGK